MSFYEKILRDLIQHFHFYVEESGGEKTSMTVEEVLDHSIVGPYLSLVSASRLGSLMDHGSLIESMVHMGSALEVGEGMMGLTLQMGHTELPMSVRLMTALHVLTQNPENENDYEPRKPGDQINITHLFLQGSELAKHYAYQQDALNLLSPEIKALIKRRAQQGCPAARIYAAQMLELDARATPTAAAEAEADAKPAVTTANVEH